MNNYQAIVKSRTIKSEYRMFKGMGLGRVVLRFDDRCDNGYNTFSITVESNSESNGFGGCMHDEIRVVFPEYTRLIKWHLVSTDGPMHYIANTVYWANKGNLDYARSSAVARFATIEQLSDKDYLIDRLPVLMHNFALAMVSTFKIGITE